MQTLVIQPASTATDASHSSIACSSTSRRVPMPPGTRIDVERRVVVEGVVGQDAHALVAPHRPGRLGDHDGLGRGRPSRGTMPDAVSTSHGPTKSSSSASSKSTMP